MFRSVPFSCMENCTIPIIQLVSFACSGYHKKMICLIFMPNSYKPGNMKSVYVPNVNKLPNNSHLSCHSSENESNQTIQMWKCIFGHSIERSSAMKWKFEWIFCKHTHTPIGWVGGYLVAMRLSLNALDVKSIPGASKMLKCYWT